MTTIDITDIPAARPEPTRDRYGRPLVTPVDGGKPVGYTRVTTLAKTLDDGGGLIPWKATATIVGAMRRQGLFARWQALASKAEGDPWYHSADTKKEAKRLVEECAEAGGSTDRADLGTALHAIAEQADAGLPVHIQPGLQADLDAYHATLKAAGVEILPDWMERFVVLDDWKIAGTFDRMVRMPDGRLLIADLKTGADLKYSWQSIAVQIAIYAHGVDYDIPTGTRTPLPDHDITTGLVIHLPAGTGTCTLYEVDLEAGWEAAELSLRTRAWRTRKDLAVPLPANPKGGEGVPALPSTSEKTTSSVNTGSEGTPPATGTANNTDGRPADRRAWLLERIAELAAIPEAKTVMRALWPADVPMSRSHPHTDHELDAIQHVLETVEARHEAPFTPGPATVVDPRPPTLTVVADRPDDTDLMGPADVAALAAVIGALTPERQQLLRTAAAAANAAGHSISITRVPSKRRFQIARMLIAWSDHGEDALQAAFRYIGSSGQLGELVGECTYVDATTLVTLAAGLPDDWCLYYDAEGPYLGATDLPAQ
jgi:hypothetical protein